MRKTCFSWNLKPFMHKCCISIRICSNSTKKKKKKQIPKKKTGSMRWPRAVYGGRRETGCWVPWRLLGSFAAAGFPSSWPLFSFFQYKMVLDEGDQLLFFFEIISYVKYLLMSLNWIYIVLVFFPLYSLT